MKQKTVNSISNIYFNFFCLKRAYSVLVFTFMLMLSFNMQAQNVEFTSKNFKGKHDQLKKAKQALKIGYYHFGEARYPIALDYLIDAQRFNPNNAELNYKLGICYIQTYNKYTCLSFFKKAYSLDKNVASDIHYLLARGYHLNYQFFLAIDEYKEHLNSLASEERVIWQKQIEKRIQECEDANKLIMRPLDVRITNIGITLNSRYPDYRPFITANDSMMIFTSRRATTTGKKQDPTDFKYFEDIYVSYFEKGVWTRPKGISNLNTVSHDAVVGMSPDASKVVYYDGSKNGGDLSISYQKNRRWSVPKELPKEINSQYCESSASFTAGGDTMYFVSEKPDGSYGGKDIYYTIIDGAEEYTIPKNIGNTINTEYDEEGVVIHPSGNIMYFSSKGHNTMGGFDIFKTTKKNGVWSKPINIGYPLNTTDDDVFFVISKSGQHGYLASAREDALGGQDIYKIKFYRDPETGVAFENPELDSEDSVFLATRVIDENLAKVLEEYGEEVIKTDSTTYVIADASTKTEDINIVDTTLLAINSPEDIVVENVEEIIVEEVIEEVPQPVDVTIEIVDIYSDDGIITRTPLDNDSELTFTLPPDSETEVEIEVNDVRTTYGRSVLISSDSDSEVLMSEQYSEGVGVNNYSDRLVAESQMYSNDEVWKNRKKKPAVSATPPSKPSFTNREAIHYAIQVRAERSPYEIKNFKKLKDVQEYHCSDGWYRYVVFEVKGWNAATIKKSEVVKLGYTKAFIVNLDELKRKVVR